MIKLVVFYFLFISIASDLAAQTNSSRQLKNKNGTFYLAFGSHRTFYTPSNIRFVKGAGSNYFDFTLFKVKAEDEGGFSWKTAPEFTYTIGYYFNKKNFGIEYQYDHLKYFVDDVQKVHLKGWINGTYHDQDTLLTPTFVDLEHSDGANYAMVNILKWWPVSLKKNAKSFVDLITKAGIGLVNPKTNSTIMGNHRDDQYHISGYVIGGEVDLKVHFLKHFFIEGGFKGTFANYNHFLIYGGLGQQKWFSSQFNYLLGGQFPL